MNKDKIILIISNLMNGRYDDSEVDNIITSLKKDLKSTTIADLIFYNNENLSAEQIYEKAIKEPRNYL